MKKILVLMIVLSMQICSVNARSVVRLKNEYICNDNNIYQVPSVEVNYWLSYFLNPSNNYNTNIDDYYEISFEEAGINKDVLTFSTFNSYLTSNGIPNFETYTHLFIFKYLYPDENWYVCNNDRSQVITQNQVVIDFIHEEILNAINGPGFLKETQYLKSGEEKQYQYDYFKYFEIVNTNGLEATIKNNILSIKGKPGKYELVFKSKDRHFNTPTLLTDGTNYIIMAAQNLDKVYKMKIEIDMYNLKIKTIDENQNAINDKCYYIFNNEIIVKRVCSNELGIIDLSLPSNKYIISEENGSFKQEIDLTQNTVIENIVTPIDDNKPSNEENDHISPLKEEDSIELLNEETKNIMLKDTASYKGLIFPSMIFSLLVIRYFVSKKIK